MRKSEKESGKNGCPISRKIGKMGCKSQKMEKTHISETMKMPCTTYHSIKIASNKNWPKNLKINTGCPFSKYKEKGVFYHELDVQFDFKLKYEKLDCHGAQLFENVIITLSDDFEQHKIIQKHIHKHESTGGRMTVMQTEMRRESEKNSRGSERVSEHGSVQGSV